MQLMASPSLRDEVASTVKLYSTFIKKMKAKNPQLNVSDVSFDCGKGGKNSFGKRGSSGISNVLNTAVDDRLVEKHEYHPLTPEQNNMLGLKLLKRGHVGNCHGGNGMELGKATGKDLLSNHPPAPSRRWLPSLKKLSCLIVMMINPHRRRKVSTTDRMLI
jgi:hypothetical protein